MSGMAMVPELPEVPGSAAPPGPRPTALSSAVWFVALLAGSAALGLLGGLIWGEVAPRVLLQEVSAGTAEIVPNLKVFTGGAEYGEPSVQGVFELDE